MSSTCNPASSMAIRLARATRTETEVPELRVNSVQPSPVIAVWLLIGNTGIGSSPQPRRLTRLHCRQDVIDRLLELRAVPKLAEAALHEFAAEHVFSLER